LISRIGVPLFASMYGMLTIPFLKSMFMIGTAVIAIGFGRTGERVANIPITSGAFL